jgi:hypothetical protein
MYVSMKSNDRHDLNDDGHDYAPRALYAEASGREVFLLARSIGHRNVHALGLRKPGSPALLPRRAAQFERASALPCDVWNADSSPHVKIALYFHKSGASTMSLGYDDTLEIQEITYEQIHQVVNDDNLLWLASLQTREDEFNRMRPPWFATSMRGRSKTCDSPHALKVPLRPSSFPGFDVLPMETAHAILTQLDFRSLRYLSQTCSKARSMVISLPEYRAFEYHIPEFLRLLDKSGITEWHSAATLYSAFRSASCEMCGHHDTSLYLPTCQRYCKQCWLDDPSDFYILHESMLRWLPNIARSLTKEPILRARFLPSPEHNGDFICVTRAHLYTIAQQLHQSGTLWFQLMRAYERIHSALTQDRLEDPWDSWSMSKAMQRVAQRQTVDPPAVATFTFLIQLDKESRELLFVRLPYLNDSGQIGRELFCRVCAQASREDRLSRLPAPVSIRIEGDSNSTTMRLDQAAQLAWTRAGFFEHIRECPGIKFLMDRRYAEATKR